MRRPVALKKYRVGWERYLYTIYVARHYDNLQNCTRKTFHTQRLDWDTAMLPCSWLLLGLKRSLSFLGNRFISLLEYPRTANNMIHAFVSARVCAPLFYSIPSTHYESSISSPSAAQVRTISPVFPLLLQRAVCCMQQIGSRFVH